jgi:septation ring formation regulator EzrA
MHATRKIENAQKNLNDIAKNEETLRKKVDSLKKELITVQREADNAQGALLYLSPFTWLTPRCRGTEEGFST